MQGSQVSLSISSLVSSINNDAAGNPRVLTACAKIIAIELASPTVADPTGRYRLKQQARLSSMAGQVSLNSSTSILLNILIEVGAPTSF